MKEFCEKINMPQEVTNVILAESENDRFFGLGILKSMLAKALEVKEEYQKRGIDESIFFDTMGCFSRFVKEYRESYGVYGFDRGWWTWRQLSLVLFRLGSLEFECAELKGEKAISVHIPSDADLSENAVNDSFDRAREFFRGENLKFFCESWLLSPALKKLLPAESKIIRFAERFRVMETNEEAEDYIQWVYKNPGLLPKEFPEETSLQRNMKRFVLSGGKIGDALGILR